jgi:hypothetical protein
MPFKKILFVVLLICTNLIFSQKYNVIESNTDYIKVEIDFSNAYSLQDTVINGIEFNFIKWEGYAYRNQGEPLLPTFHFSLGIPLNSNPQLTVLNFSSSKRTVKPIMPYQQIIDGKQAPTLEFDKAVYNKNALFPVEMAKIEKPFMMRFTRIAPVMFSPYQYNPVTRELVFNNKMTVQIKYNNAEKGSEPVRVADKMSEDFLNTSVINSGQALKWMGKSQPMQTDAGDSRYWYSPSKDYYKIYLKEKGVYRVAFEDLVSAGFSLPFVNVKSLELYCNGKLVPIDVVVKASGIFGPGDYIQFVGYPPEPSPYVSTNIYNNSNVYWLSYQSELGGLYYADKDGYPVTYDNTFKISPKTLHYEKDLIYEQLGYAPNNQRDYWFWDRVTGSYGNTDRVFHGGFDALRRRYYDSTYITLRVNMHGMTSNDAVDNDHNAKVGIATFNTSTDNKLTVFGNCIWDGQTSYTFEKYLNSNSDNFQLKLYNEVVVSVDGNLPGYTNMSDEIRMNWFEIDYWIENMADTNHYYFKSPLQASGKTRFTVWEWKRDNMKIYIPEKGQLISNPFITYDIYSNVFFVDSCYSQTEYFCVANDYFMRPDSIRKNSMTSDLRNIQNQADIIVITHPKFMAAAERYANFRLNNFPDSAIHDPKIKIVDVFSIYNEFSYGLLNPYSLQDFTRYAFTKWSGRPVQYVVLLGDMSWDYRQLLSTSRPNFVPSVPYHAEKYGQAASDNLIACVSGEDSVPDLAIGRLSCETVDEANILIDKIVNYPADKGKQWKQNVLLVASGKDESDENTYGFNYKANDLERKFLTPAGIHSTKIFRFPNNDIDRQYTGGELEIRKGIDEGAAIVNFYGHGGGYQWDFVFLNDDIPMLQNGGRLPFVLSVTCYTAHFDNQEIFGEIFNKAPGKGSIGFWGSAGLTYWVPGWDINEVLYDQIFNKKNFVIGNAILKAKGNIIPSGEYLYSLALLTYLGDPALSLALPDKPDFEVKSSDISISPENPVVGDTVRVKVYVRNNGMSFAKDTLTVQLFANGTDSLSLIGKVKRLSFGDLDSMYFDWMPKEGKLYNLIVKVNDVDKIAELDYSDNTANASFAVYNVADPNFIAPINGFATNNKQVEFVISDAGYYVNKNLSYFIEIDTTGDFTSLIQASSPIIPKDGFARWKSSNLANGVYFWHARINDGVNYGRWSPVRTFSISNSSKDGYFASGRLLKTFTTHNLNYSDSDGKLTLNTELLPPYPNEKSFLDNMNLNVYPSDSTSLTTLASDGTYLYFATYAYYNSRVKSWIYKIGTGNNGTIRGRSYGVVPNFYRLVSNSIFYHKDGFLYAAVDNDVHSILRINPTTGDTLSIPIPEGFINKDRAVSENGTCYLTSDGTYVYNIAIMDKNQSRVYTLRIFDPSKNWARVGTDKVLNGVSYGSDFTGFFVCGDYLYTAEVMMGGHLKRFKISDGTFEEEWYLYGHSNNSLFSWWYDWTNNSVYSGAKSYSGDSYLRIYRFEGKYLASNGNLISQEIGPGSKWQNLTFELDTVGSLGSYTASVEGLNKKSNSWDTVAVKIPKTYSLSKIDQSKYNYLRFNLQLTDTSKAASLPMKFKSLNISYTPPAEIVLRKTNISFSPDTLLQGFQTMLNIKAENFGYNDADSVRLDCYLDGADSVFYSPVISIKKDTLTSATNIINTTTLLPSTVHNIKVIAKTGAEEFFSNNNITNQSFYVARDSVNPRFSITYDGKEILDNDVISSRPKIIISLKDEGPLPLSKLAISVVHSSDVDKPELLDTLSQDIQFSLSGYPNNMLEMIWSPKLKDGRHFLEIIGKDASGNLFDTVSYKKVFYVYNKADIRNIYNYPNPFKNDTYFTFDLYGSKVPDELYIKIYTVAGRLIKTINIPQSQIQIGFNRFYWDGKDQDGDELANGLYFYKIVYKNNELFRTEIQKLAKVK